MAAAVAGYSHDHFQSLPDLNSARDNFIKLNGPKLVEDVFKDFFITNGMDRTFGLAMPHRHFDILPGQMIVNYNGTSTAWNASPGEGMDEPQPAIWSFSSSGELVPHEFRYSKGHKFEMGEKERAFVAKFKRLLDEKNVAGMFGLCEYLGDDFEGTCEITMFSANINLKPKDYPEGLMGIDTAWFFSPPLRKRYADAPAITVQPPMVMAPMLSRSQLRLLLPWKRIVARIDAQQCLPFHSLEAALRIQLQSFMTG